MGCNLFSQNPVFARINDVDPARLRGDSAALQGGVMGRRINPACQSGDDDKACGGQTGGQRLGHAGAKRRCIARADHGDHGPLQ